MQSCEHWGRDVDCAGDCWIDLGVEDDMTLTGTQVAQAIFAAAPLGIVVPRAGFVALWLLLLAFVSGWAV